MVGMLQIYMHSYPCLSNTWAHLEIFTQRESHEALSVLMNCIALQGQALREKKHYTGITGICLVCLSSLWQQEAVLSNQYKPILCHQLQRAPYGALFMLVDSLNWILLKIMIGKVLCSYFFICSYFWSFRIRVLKKQFSLSHIVLSTSLSINSWQPSFTWSCYI